MISYEQTGADDLTFGPAAKLLVVDDEIMITTMLSEILIEDGYEVATADDGNQAIKLLERDRFDLVITDLVMPDVDGTEVLRAVSRIDSQCPVVVITGYPSLESMGQLIEMGAVDFLTKPFNVDMIRLTVAKILKMSRSRSLAQAEGGTDQLAAIDGETQAYNLRLFGELLERELGRSEQRGRYCSALVLEIDDFDSLASSGQTFDGEGPVATLATLLRNESRPEDVIGRTGDGEMAVILPESGSEEAAALGETVRRKAEWRFTITAGVACFPDDAQDAHTLIKVARSAIQAGVAGGGNAVLKYTRAATP